MLKDVKGVGQRHTVQEVSDGYGFNFLIAQGLAEQATAHKLAALEAQQKTQSAASAEKERAWADITKRIEHSTITVKARANSGGHLYEQLAPGVIVAALHNELKSEIPSDAIKLDAPIKNVGEHLVGVRLGTNTARFKIVVVAVR